MTVKMSRLFPFVALLSLLPHTAFAQQHPTAQVPRDSGTWQAEGRQGAVVAGGAGAVSAGIETLKAGGNATDGAVATILALAVTDATSFCFGGEVPIMIFNAKTKHVEVLAGMGAAPSLATRDYFVNHGGIPGKGLTPAAVPAVVDVLVTALDRHGSITFEKAAQPMLKLLDAHEKPWHADLARTVRRLIDAERRGEGDRPRGLRLVSDEFYRGSVARDLDAWCKANGGLIRYGDLARHVTRVEEPVVSEYRGYRVYKCGPWTQGPWLLEALQMLEGFDMRALGHNSADAIHLTDEAMKLAMADRDLYYADPLFVDVPIESLLSRGYAEARRGLIDPRHASLELRPGDPRAGKPLWTGPGVPRGDGGPARDTTTCLVADRDGNIVAATPSGWSGVVAGETGVWLGSRLQSFNTWPDHPNRIEPGKRPRITLSPTLILDAATRAPRLAVSVAGGDNQDMMTLQLVLNHVDFGLAPAVSVTAPRFMSDHFVSSFLQKPPVLGGLRINPTISPSTLDDLAARGHKLAPSPSILSAAPTVLAVDPQTHHYHAAGDPRARRHAGAY